MRGGIAEVIPVLKECSRRSDQTRDSTSNRDCSCTTFTPCVPADPPGTGSFYGWTVGEHGYEPVPTLDPMAPEELLQFTTCICHGDYSNRRCSCKKHGVTCISTCGVCKGITCRNCSHDDVESEEDIGHDC